MKNIIVDIVARNPVISSCVYNLDSVGYENIAVILHVKEAMIKCMWNRNDVDKIVKMMVLSNYENLMKIAAQVIYGSEYVEYDE